MCGQPLLSAHYCHETAAKRPPHDRHTTATRPPHDRHMVKRVKRIRRAAHPSRDRCVYSTKKDLWGRRVRVRPFHTFYHVAVVWRSCGGRVAVVWRSCGGRRLCTPRGQCAIGFFTSICVPPPCPHWCFQSRQSVDEQNPAPPIQDPLHPPI